MARILIVDDDVASARSLRKLLRASGHDQIRVARSAATALKAAVALDPAFIFLDVELPDMSGYDVALLLHQHPQLQNARLIALTDSGAHPGREHARSSGFERYLVKPVVEADLEAVLSSPPP